MALALQVGVALPSEGRVVVCWARSPAGWQSGVRHPQQWANGLSPEWSWH